MSGVSSHKAPQADIDALLYAMPSGLETWNADSKHAAPLNITYRFDSIQPVNPAMPVFTGWTPFTADQEAAILAGLAEYSSIINVTFTEASALDPDPTLDFGRVNLSSGEAGEGGFAYSYATAGGIITSRTLNSFAVFDNSLTTIDPAIILHEVGHAFTMKHPGNYDAGGGGSPAPYLPSNLDNNKYSVMSYNVDPDNHETSPHLMLFDIAALQQRFGANLSTATGNNVYTGPNGSLQCIWDAGGTDRIDGSGYSTSVTIDLREGHFSSLGATDNLAIAYGVIIENATGGSGNDTVIGNQWANVLKGGAGNDHLNGGSGGDTLDGGSGNDVLTGGNDSDTFLFDTKLASTGVDKIKDFVPGEDHIDLDHGIFTPLAAGALPDDDFAIGSHATTPTEHILYNVKTGGLLYDADGVGGADAVRFAALAAGLDLSAADFIIT